jgi:hypothetical protein
MIGRVTESSSAERQAFDYYLRTGRRSPTAANRIDVEYKFNPYHDPRNGQFTFAPGGPRSLGSVVVSHRRASHRAKQNDANRSASGDPGATARRIPPADRGKIVPAIFQPAASSEILRPVNLRPNPGARIGNNGGPPLNDPATLERVFPGLATAPGGSLITIADNILDLTGPATQLTTSMAEGHLNKLIQDIRKVDPDYRLDTLGFPVTAEGQINLIRQLRIDRAVAYYRIRREVRPLQVETLRSMQERADTAYDEGVVLYDAGRLQARLSREEAIGNYVDRAVRRDLRKLYEQRGIDVSKGQIIRVVGREYETRNSDLTYRIPDARVDKVAFDVTLARKTLATPQVRGFFASDFQPDIVVIIRPRQLGRESSYALTRQGK